VRLIVQILVAAAAFLLVPLLQADAYSWCWHLARWIVRRRRDGYPSE
jgi:hypothetical protein